MTDNLSLGRQIRRARTLLSIRTGRRVSQADLARMVGVSRSAVNSWENDRTVPDEFDRVALEKALGADLKRVSLPPAAHLRRLVGELNPEERARLLAELQGRPPPPQSQFVSAEAGRHRRAG